MRAIAVVVIFQCAVVHHCRKVGMLVLQNQCISVTNSKMLPYLLCEFIRVSIASHVVRPVVVAVGIGYHGET